MKVADFDFDLPDDRIALRPVSPRDAARQLVVRGGAFIDSIVSALPAFLAPGDVMVFNDTRVIPARLRGLRPADSETAANPRAQAKIEATLHLQEGPSAWRAFVRPAKRLRAGDTVDFTPGLNARVEEKGEGGEVLLSFNCTGLALEAAIAEAGEMPLPPYIAGKRPADRQDAADYQTIYARRKGAVAAPTAGLHFTDDLIAAIDQRGIGRVTTTLHVGAGTFLPVKAEDTKDHKMHAEWGELTAKAADTINAARNAGGRIVAVGTTALRLLESAADNDGVLHPFKGQTDIFITPGYHFKAVDVLMTNFHLPRSTLFMLVSAFCGLETMRAAYAHAIGQGYRFYSYGDSCLLFKD